MKTWFGAFVLILALALGAYAQPDKYSYSKLAGKWEGAPPQGGRLEIDITVSPVGEITGTGLIQQKRRNAHPSVSGKVTDRKVTLQTYFPTTHTTVTYVCDWVEKKLLQCVTRGSKFETEFKKVD